LSTQPAIFSIKTNLPTFHFGILKAYITSKHKYVGMTVLGNMQ